MFSFICYELLIMLHAFCFIQLALRLLGDGLEPFFFSLTPLIVDAIDGLEMLCAGIGIGGVGISLGCSYQYYRNCCWGILCAFRFVVMNEP